MNPLGVDEIAGPVVPVNPFTLDTFAKSVVFQVFEIQKSSDWKNRDYLNAMLQIVCKKFKALVFDYNRTPRYTLATNWNTVHDIVADFKDGHLAKMLRELNLMQYWNNFKKYNMYTFATNVKNLDADLHDIGIHDQFHHILIKKYITHEALLYT